jgi:hypothetical protein
MDGIAVLHTSLASHYPKVGLQEGRKISVQGSVTTNELLYTSEISTRNYVGQNSKFEFIMQRFSRQALLLRTKVQLIRRKEHLLMSIISLVPKWSGSESAILLERL